MVTSFCAKGHLSFPKLEKNSQTSVFHCHNLLIQIIPRIYLKNVNTAVLAML